ncbi:hypothetical protein PPHE_b0272 [Pseudoalteromonas phenolica O-BC30]|nr:hypothetical protein [Pseudoalteromonas phenolica O-BC30]
MLNFSSEKKLHYTSYKVTTTVLGIGIVTEGLELVLSKR